MRKGLKIKNDKQVKPQVKKFILESDLNNQDIFKWYKNADKNVKLHIDFYDLFFTINRTSKVRKYWYKFEKAPRKSSEKFKKKFLYSSWNISQLI